MKALILAAGRGNRLGQITDILPKPLVEVHGKPVIEYLIEKLINLNVREIFINVHYKHNLIEEFIIKNNFKVKINLIYEQQLLGTAGTLKSLINKLSEEDFIVMHADNYFEDNLERLKATHYLNGPEHLLTLGTFTVLSPDSVGTVELNDRNTVINFYEKQKDSPSNIANSAIYFMKPEIKKVVNELNENENDISLNLIPKLLGRIKSVELTGYFYDIGTPENLSLANES